MPRTPGAPDAMPLTLNLLDMGRERYGDAILCRLGGQTVLIDGGHPSDWRSRDGCPSIPDQLAQLLGHGAPFAIDLLVVTHCHSDHIGCLPTLVERGALQVAWALVADERLGFGRGADHVVPDTLSAADRLAAALREEDHADLPDDELEAFLADAATLEQRYGQMLAALEQSGTRVVRYGRDDHSALEQAFSAIGLTVLGPTLEHLILCAEAIARFNDQAPIDVRGVSDADDPHRLMAVYRSLLQQADSVAAGAEDRPGKGAAINDQSLVLAMRDGDAAVLLAGDMQFAAPEVSGLQDHMLLLRRRVADAGPYRFIKLSHHASYNGVNASLLDEWTATTAFAHSGGINDPTHPDAEVLELLDARRDRLQWARTDRNGLITVTFPDGGVSLAVTRGELNDPTPNADMSEPEGPQEPLPTGPEAGPPGISEVTTTARIGPDVSRVTVTIDVTRPGAGPTAPVSRDRVVRRVVPSRRPSVPQAWTDVQLAAGRRLPALLFATYRPRLENNLGAAEAAAALALIRRAGQTVYEVSNPGQSYREIARQLQRPYQGVVILGGYDVLPAQRLDVLPPSLRQQVGPNSQDADNFIVWNDEAYGDRDGDRLPELPVSRIPDAKSPKLVLAALTAARSSPPTRFGVRNVARPFATGPYGVLPGTTALLVSEPTTPSRIGAGRADGGHVYLMLHGSDLDASRFWGEDNGATIEAVTISNIPRRFTGVVFTGCCWGALTVQVIAAQAAPGQPIGVRTPGTSIALSYLHAGACAFVGCTGTHYSPTVAPYDYFGGPMHTAFWARYTEGRAPADALFAAKQAYLAGMPHGQTSAMGQAIEYKILRQFTCLGLGW